MNVSGVSSKSVFPECLTGMSSRIVLHECLPGLSFWRVFQECLTRTLQDIQAHQMSLAWASRLYFTCDCMSRWSDDLVTFLAWIQATDCNGVTVRSDFRHFQVSQEMIFLLLLHTLAEMMGLLAWLTALRLR